MGANIAGAHYLVPTGRSSGFPVADISALDLAHYQRIHFSNYFISDS